MTTWLAIVAIGLITYAIRLAFIVLLGHWTIPDPVMRSLRFVPPSVFAAIVLPEIFSGNGAGVSPLQNPRLISAIVAALIAWKTKSILLTLLAGFAVLFLVQALL